MRSFVKWVFGSLVALGTVVVARPSFAEGAVLTPGALEPAERSNLEAQIAAARARRPATFRAVRAVDTFRGRALTQARHNQPTAARAFMRLGRDALLPMLEMIAWSADLRGLDEAQKRAVGDGLLQAVAVARDPRAAPVLGAVFSKSQDPRFVATAAAGLGMLCRPEDRALLLSHADAGSSRRAAALAGMGHCRSVDVVEKLATALAEPLDDETAQVTARALGYVGSTWALASAKLDAKQADVIRKKAATALVLAFSRASAPARPAIARALLMVEHPSALPPLREAERAGSPSVRTEASALRARLEKNLARPRR